MNTPFQVLATKNVLRLMFEPRYADRAEEAIEYALKAARETADDARTVNRMFRRYGFGVHIAPVRRLVLLVSGVPLINDDNLVEYLNHAVPLPSSFPLSLH